MKDDKKKSDFAVVKIKKSTHKKLKIEAAEKGKTIQELVEEKLKAAS